MTDILNAEPVVEETSLETEASEVTTNPEVDATTVEASETTEVVLPETYELPEGFVAMEGFDVNEVGKSLGLDQEKFNTLMGKYGELESKRLEVEHAQRVNAVSELFKGEGELKSFEAKAKTLLGEDYEVLRDATSGNATAPASVLKLVQKYMMKSEHQPSVSVNSNPSLSEGDLYEMMKDSRYKTDPDYRNKVSEGFKMLYN